MDTDDLLPDLDLAQIMQQRPLGLGSVRHVLRIAIAVTVSWAVAVAVSHSQLALFAPITTLLVVQSSAWTTLGMSIQRILGTGIGVLVASVWVNLVGLTWWSFFIGVGAALLIARMLPWSLGGQLQIPVAVVFVLAIGPGSIGQDAWRVADVFIGGAIGLLAVFIYPPKPRPEVLDGALRTYRDAIIETMRQVGAASGSLAEPLVGAQPHDYVATSRRLRDLADTARSELVRFVEGAHLNLRARGLQDLVQAKAVQLRRLGGIGVQVRGIVGAANRLYDRPTVSPLLSGEEFGALVDRLVALMECVLGGPGQPVGGVDRGAASELDSALEAELRRAADSLVDTGGGLGGALGSVGLVGRLDLVRIQLLEYREWEN
ncbi:MAG: hypothetical protein QG661_1840 [Actinomycetota bacterium]|nr:hypothetical protein [Actinomycetota bacterium]